MECRCWLPERKATSSSAGVGLRPWAASDAATIMVSEMQGSSASAMTGPISGRAEIRDMLAMPRKNRAARARAGF
jgi:hypothetical protein